MEPWRSRWSLVRLVKMAPAKRVPATRFRAMPCEETSMTTLRTPAPSIAASVPCTSVASGVVLTAGRRSPPETVSAVVMSPHSPSPWAPARIAYKHVGGGGLAVGARNAVDPHAPRRVAVDLPASAARAARASPTTAVGTPGTSRSATTREAPRRTASGANSVPSRLKPGTATKAKPGSTRRESCVTPRTPRTGRDLHPENLGKLCPVQDHHPSVARAITEAALEAAMSV